MKPILSIILPSIRVDRLPKLYNSVFAACTYPWEMVVCGPYYPQGFDAVKNFRWAKDFGSPNRCQQIAGTLAEGELLTYVADDAIILPGSLDRMIQLHRENPGGKTVVIAKYFEGRNGIDHKPLQPDRYFQINGAGCTASPYIPDSYWIYNIALMRRVYWEYLGGWDASYQCTAIAHSDLAVRSQYDGAKVVMSDLPLLDCDHEPNTTGLHAPVHYSQGGNDEPLFQKTYRDPDWRNKIQVRIPVDNWKSAPAVWEARFKTGTI